MKKIIAIFITLLFLGTNSAMAFSEVYYLKNATVEANYKSANEEHLVENVIVTYKDNDERQHVLTNNFTFKKGLPVQHKTTEKIDDSKTETVYKYTYSKVKFSAPSTEGATPLA
jgi:hypothetical protein